MEATDRYLERITQGSWVGNSSFDGTRKEGIQYTGWHIKKLAKSCVWHFFHKILPVGNRTMRLAYQNEEFLPATKDYLDEIAQLFAPQSKMPVFNQFISAFQPELCLKYFSDARAIIVDRDPRDIYILGKIKHETACYPSDDPKKFVAWYKTCWKNHKKVNSDQVLYMQFEDMVYHYDRMAKQIEEFLGITDHKDKKKYLKPEVSINNTQLKQRFPEMREEIEYIERELKEYLYDFPPFEPTTKDFF